MRCSTSALVLATLAAGQAAAVNIRHSNFHARRVAQPVGNKVEIDLDVLKREASETDWTKVDWSAIDWKNIINWSTVNYGGASSTTAAAVASSVAQQTTLASVVVAAAATTTAQAPASTTQAAAATTSKSSTNVVGEILSDVAKTALLALGIKSVGLNPTSNSGNGVWIGSDGNYKQTFNNNAGQDITVVCWGPSGSWVNVNVPLITISLSSGDSQTVSYASGHSGACSAIYSGTKLVNGQVSNTWIEYTFDDTYGVFDVSREVNMNGNTISTKGNKCTSDMNTCVFKCNSGDVCTTGYSLQNCGSSNGGGAGTYDGAASGGCMMESGGDHLQTTFS